MESVSVVGSILHLILVDAGGRRDHRKVLFKSVVIPLKPFDDKKTVLKFSRYLYPFKSLKKKFTVHAYFKTYFMIITLLVKLVMLNSDVLEFLR